MRKVLIVDDEEEALDVLCDYLTDLGYVAQKARDGAEALEALQMDVFDLLILDLRMPGVDGEEVLKQLDACSPRTSVIVATGYCDAGRTKERIQQYNIDAYLEKPIDLDVFDHALIQIAEKRKHSS